MADDDVADVGGEGKARKAHVRYVYVAETHDRNEVGLIRLESPPSPLPGRIAVCRTAFNARTPASRLRAEAALVVRFRHYCVVWRGAFALTLISKSQSIDGLPDDVAAIANLSDDAALADAILPGTRALFAAGADEARVQAARDLVEAETLKILYTQEGLNESALSALGVPAHIANRIAIENAGKAIEKAVARRGKR